MITISIAEVVVCWALVGVTFESLTHIGHSAPFNQLNMMVFLLIPGFLTSLFYFI